MRDFGAYAIAVAIVLSVICCANFALASQTTPLVSNNSAIIGNAPVGNDLSLIDSGGFLRLLGGFLRIGITGDSVSDTTPPSAPTDLTAVAASLSELDLSWNASNDNGGRDSCCSYQIYRDGSEVGTTSATTYADTGLTASSTHSYVVKAYDAANNVSSASNTATSTTGVWADGFTGAPAGTAQYPTLLQGYTARPPWRVAGVDYPVGIPTGTTLSDPSTINISGVTVNTSSHEVEVNTNNPVTISRIDFSLDGGWQLVIGDHVTSNNVTVTDSNFAIGSNGNAMVNQVSGSNTVFEYDVFNGNDLPDNLNGTVFNLNGGTTIEYCLIENEAGDFIDYGTDNIAEFNLWINDGQEAGSHPDWLQLGGGTYTNQTFNFELSPETSSKNG